MHTYLLLTIYEHILLICSRQIKNIKNLQNIDLKQKGKGTVLLSNVFHLIRLNLFSFYYPHTMQVIIFIITTIKQKNFILKSNFTIDKYNRTFFF